MSDLKIVCKVPISVILFEISKSIVPVESHHIFSFFSNGKKNTISLYGPVRFSELFSVTDFFKNYYIAFGQRFVLKEYTIEMAANLDMQVVEDVDTKGDGVPNIIELELASFRCDCYPTTDNEYFSLMAGVGMNCTSISCRSELEANPLIYDESIHTECTNNAYNSVYLSLKNIITDKVTLDKINIIQGVVVDV